MEPVEGLAESRRVRRARRAGKRGVRCGFGGLGGGGRGVGGGRWVWSMGRVCVAWRACLGELSLGSAYRRRSDLPERRLGERSAGLLEPGLEVRLRGLQSILVRRAAMLVQRKNELLRKYADGHLNTASLPIFMGLGAARMAA